MKKALILIAVGIFTAVMIFTLGALDTSAEIYSGSCGDSSSNVTWTLDTVTGILSLKGSGSSRDYSKAAVSGSTAPPWRKYADSIKTVSVDGLSGVGKYSFANCENLTSVSFSDNVTVIAEGVFFGCTSLKGFTFSDSVTEIGASAFYNCRSIIELHLPKNLMKIGKGAFAGCSGIKNVSVAEGNIAFRAENNCLIDIVGSSVIRGSVSGEIPVSVESIGEDAFSGCANLKSVTVPENILYIGYGAFSGCTGLTEITLPFIGDCRVGLDGNPEYVLKNDKGEEFSERGKLQNCLWYVFGDLKTPESLKKVVVTDTQTLGLEAFAECKNIECVELCDSIVRIDSGAFYGCSSLAQIKIPIRTVTIGDSAFYACTKLESVIIPDSTVTLGASAFAKCTKLRSLTLGSALSSIGNDAFDSCADLESITVSAANKTYRSGTGCIIEIETQTLFLGCNGTVIPDDIRVIGNGAFKNCMKITSVVIPETVKKIGDSAFEGCRNMISIKLPEGLEHIGDYAFADCTSLESVTIPASVSHIGDSAFKNCTSFKSNGNASPLDDEINCSGCNGCSGAGAMLFVAIVTVCAFAAPMLSKKK